MPYKVFVAGEEALAADANAYLMSQTVARFSSASQRTSQLPAPVLNQLSMRDDSSGTIEYWGGSTWLKVNSDGVAVNYAPAWLPGSGLGAGSVAGRYRMVAPFLMNLQVLLTLGAGAALPAGVVAIGLPAGYTSSSPTESKDQFGTGLMSFFGRGAFPLLTVSPATDGSRIFFQVPRGATPGVTDGSVAVILEQVSSAAPAGWAVSGSFIRANILLDVQQRF